LLSSCTWKTKSTSGNQFKLIFNATIDLMLSFSSIQKLWRQHRHLTNSFVLFQTIMRWQCACEDGPSHDQHSKCTFNVFLDMCKEV
jgi:hypothetical protein